MFSNKLIQTVKLADKQILQKKHGWPAEIKQIARRHFELGNDVENDRAVKRAGADRTPGVPRHP